MLINHPRRWYNYKSPGSTPAFLYSEFASLDMALEIKLASSVGFLNGPSGFSAPSSVDH
jgi:hypothetical protein